MVDGLPQGAVTRYIREVLVSTGILPHRQETLARLQLWARDTVGALPPHQARVIRPFAEWCVVRDARRRAAAAVTRRKPLLAIAETSRWLPTS